jgi:predicted RNase H-like HicB family nuclease
MRNEFTAIYELYEESPEPFYFARCAELIGVGAKGKTIDEARARLSAAIRLTLEERGAKGMEEIQIHVSPEASRETVVVQSLRNEFTAVVEWGEGWYIAFCPELPAANGQGKTKEEAKQSLAGAILMLLEDRRNDSFRGIPDEAFCEVIVV